MYAIVEIAGMQYKAEEGRKLYVNLLSTEVGSSVVFDKVLLFENENDIKVGTPVVAGAKVEAKVLANVKGDTVIVFKKKRRKGYKKRNGHRQKYSQIEIVKIVA